MKRHFFIGLRAVVFCLPFIAGLTALAFPMKPDIKLLLNEAKRPPLPYVPARAGWDGPEDKSAAMTNPIYDQLRHEATPDEVRQRLLATAMPDWRIVLFIVGLIVSMRVLKFSRKAVPKSAVIVFPSPSSAFSQGNVRPSASEAA